MSAQEMGGLKKRIEEIGRSEGELKAKIEVAVLDNYGRRIELEISP